ncbi:MAG: hypothetical protein DCC75_01225 [Proteobacteria bacterium]|nr:MAG: hypothetical protein DCC75_01225 [Pseudomonadota bacterium]
MNVRHAFGLIRPVIVAIILAGLLSCAPREGSRVEPSRLASKPETFHLGSHTFPISTTNPEAQSAFDRGLTWAYGFSHQTAEAEFRRAAALDPAAPMPWWGVALVNGPHINYPLVPENKAKVAWEALLKAKELRSNGGPLERDLIDALSARYAEKQPEDRSLLDQAYAEAMRKVWERYPDNADVATLYAEALMDLHPWDLWEKDGAAKSWTPQIVSTLERAMALNSRHPGAHHLYIHAVEASNSPERGVNSADTLRSLVPASGHLVHMPAHIYLRVGRWQDAAQSNIDAVRADQEFSKSNPNPGFYAIYMLHNHHFLSFVRMMQGQKESALLAARQMIEGVPQEFIRDYGPIADGYMAIVIEVLMRFGRWEELLAEPEPQSSLPLARALRLFGRTAAFTALDRKKESLAERAKFLAAVKRVPADATFGNNKAHTLLEIARLVIDGEMAARDNRLDVAIKFLEEARNKEDTLMYDEPPDWILPVRHTLGITYLRAEKPAEAELAYRQDLAKFPRNGWSLYGLSRALSLQGREAEALAALSEFRREWSGADTRIASSCLCQPGV